MIYCMSDIHGEIIRWKDMLELILFSDEDTLYVLGDVIDRNPHGIEILWDKSVERLIFHNASDHDVYISGYAYLKPGDSAEIQNKLGRKHSYWLCHMRPIGLGRLIETSHTEEGYQELVGKYGLILSRMSRRNPSKTVMRFVLADALLDNELDTEGLETSAGKLTYEEGNRIVLQTVRSRYVFSCDN